MESMQRRINELSTPEHQNLDRINAEISAQSAKLISINQEIATKQNSILQLNNVINQKHSEIIELDEEILMQSFGLYKPKFDFINAEQYKQKLDSVRQQQKNMIKAGTAVTGATSWSVNGSESQGKKMLSDMQKLLLRAFNGECDELVAKVKYNNLEASVKRIKTSCEAISKLGKIMSISISHAYMNLKIEEIYVAFEYSQEKQKEKEAQKALREQMREEAKLQKEIEEQRKKLQKEQAHYTNAIKTLRAQLADNPEDTDIKEKLQELCEQYNETQKAIEDVDYRAANQRAGYVYIISNIGSFGENVYKIGMTRRLDPTERIDELGDASVPFDFDIHAMIFSEDAPGLESALHNAFEHRKLNLVNHRREFFNVTLDEIKDVVKKNYDKTVEFIDVADAEQYRVSQKMKTNS
ncbi:MAG: DUF4041 domain-containing protein [Clostridia bacterium]|nr:DUF4041 domain-containing protein [Clostridia bacterium]